VEEHARCVSDALHGSLGPDWLAAQRYLREARDEIDKVLAEIEPLAVEQGGTPDDP